MIGEEGWSLRLLTGERGGTLVPKRGKGCEGVQPKAASWGKGRSLRLQVGQVGGKGRSTRLQVEGKGRSLRP